ncbi:hypothetical protein Trydic_g4082 [Trypoxylus dichotomus]
MSDDVDEKKKAHRSRHSGRKAEKKKEKAKKDNNQNVPDKQRNPKAFAFNSAIGAERRFRRKQDIQTKKQHIPLVDRTPIEPPPVLIAVVGPPKVGKTTLINNLVKLFSKSPLTNIKGPVTIVTGKKRRVTLIECNNDINSMIDLAKIADLALLLCDASFGFEMEIFEFLNICQIHGMPRIMGILTHLDMIKTSKRLKNTKKTLKHRFWAEVYPGAKLFYLSGIIHGEYLRNEIKNLGRFISIMKFRPLTWRMSHSHLLADRYEDLTNLELVRQNPKCDRYISVYGYIRGIPFNKNSSVHIPGWGDVKIHDIAYLPDPCPLPEAIKKRALIEKEKLIYAPFSGVGGIVYDKDAVYVELGGSHSHKDRDKDDETKNIVTNLIDTKETLDVKMQHSELQLFTDGKKLTAEDFSKLQPMEKSDSSDGDNKKTPKIPKSQDDIGLDDELNKLRKDYKQEVIEEDGRTRRKVIFDSSDEEMEIDDVKDVKQEAPAKPITKDNKDAEVFSKVSNILKLLEKSEKQVVKSTINQVRSMQEDEDSKDEEGSDSDVEGSINSDGEFSDDDNELSSASDDEKVLTDDNELLDGSDDEKVSVDDDDEEMAVKWKENITEKAQEAYLARVQAKRNLMKLVYGVFDNKIEESDKPEDVNEDINDGEIGGLFKLVSREQQKQKIEKNSMDLLESSLLMPWSSSVEDYTDPENKWMIQDCFVTGKWKESEDASELLKLDAAEISSDSDEFGDFEDLETGEKFTRTEGDDGKPKKDDKAGDQLDKKALAEKKLRLKQKFDAEYDNEAGGSSYYDELKLSAEKQAQLNKSVFENMDDDLRVQFEGYRPGMYVRIEFQGVPAEFVTNFDPTYPLLVGALNLGEENIGYVNVKIKKHRWHKKILKSGDPVIVSLGWRRFQTVPLYSKLEDDLKFRFLKYTPEHLGCNGHFWGPITPQGTGFLALQSCEGNPEIVKRQGFRIAATGTVQELDKSTRIMKKLKLVGYPMKIYKKTAFIKGMFSSSLEVAKFEGARVKTVSGIRGQIKKAASKPEGCFRATFEDKIQLSDIVFCRTWYKVDVQKFYTPVTTLLLPPEKKNSWKGIRTKGELKREMNIQNPANVDSLYKEIVREPKVFKPLMIPRKLQQALPYRDKPKHDVKPSERKKKLDRIAVIKEPYEQKVSKVMKMIRTAYDHKQQQIKAQTKERLQKHRQMIEAIEANKARKLKREKKEVFRIRSKTQIREERKKGSESSR